MYFLGWNFQEGNVEEFLQGLKPYLPEYLYSSGITVNSLLDQYYIVPFIEEEKLYVIQNEYEFLGRQDGLIYIPDVRL
ncbi:MAG: hypothetical protein U9Q15_00055 [Patescibacteria group bacterium]|nr:hypothetical protein [Patescibacteria group bacterium]